MAHAKDEFNKLPEDVNMDVWFRWNTIYFPITFSAEEFCQESGIHLRNIIKRKVKQNPRGPPDLKNYIYCPEEKRNVSNLFIAESPDEGNANLQRYLDAYTSWNDMH